MKDSYKDKLAAGQLTEDEIDIVIHATMTLLRRHSVQGTLCPCGQDHPEAFSVSKVGQLGFITEVECEVCGNQLSTICRPSDCHYEAVEDPANLKVGDHVTWHRPYLIWHHAVVACQNHAAREITIMEYTLTDSGPFAEIVPTTIPYDKCTTFRKGSMYRAVYDDCYTSDYTRLRALKSTGLKKYDIFEQNCEHSTHWCKTGIQDSVQMEVCFTSAGKVVLLICLRLITLVILWLLQLSYKSEVSDVLRRRQEMVLNVAYMGFIAVIFFVYSLYNSGNMMQPTVREVPHDTDPCGIETGRRKCADIIHKSCCCGVKRVVCNALVVALGCASCLLCSFLDACCSVVRKNVQCGSRTLCRRPTPVMIGLFVRIFVREMIAAAGPLLVVYFEDELVQYFDVHETEPPRVKTSVVIILALIVSSIGAYVVGALVGVWIEALFRCCASSSACCRSPDVEQDGRPHRRQLADDQSDTEDIKLVSSSNG